MPTTWLPVYDWSASRKHLWVHLKPTFKFTEITKRKTAKRSKSTHSSHYNVRTGFSPKSLSKLIRHETRAREFGKYTGPVRAQRPRNDKWLRRRWQPPSNKVAPPLHAVSPRESLPTYIPNFRTSSPLNQSSDEWNVRKLRVTRDIASVSSDCGFDSIVWV
ncbi:hypothetical protein ACJJTC_019855 [Scirpophaga incertulas]